MEIAWVCRAQTLPGVSNMSRLRCQSAKFVELTSLAKLGIIICTTQLLSLILRRLRQPRVIAEVLGGILLGEEIFYVYTRLSLNLFSDSPGPTAMGRVPGEHNSFVGE